MNIENLKKFAEYCQSHTQDQTISNYNYATETLYRTIRKAKEYNLLPKDFKFPTTITKNAEELKKQKLSNQLLEKFTESELKTILEGSNHRPKDLPIKSLNYNKQCVTIGIMSDTHIGSICFDENDLDRAFEEFDKANVDFIVHPGDILEGHYSNRPGHVYELTHIGYKNQIAYAKEVLSRTTKDIYALNGNHDSTFLKTAGANVCEDLASKIDNLYYIGDHEGSLIINYVEIRLWHGEDGASQYAKSYRLQKIIESLSINDRPSILIAGHDHKSIWMPDEQGVTTIGAGCIQSQTKWMRAKRLAAMHGFWIVKLYIDSNKLVASEGKWHKLS